LIDAAPSPHDALVTYRLQALVIVPALACSLVGCGKAIAQIHYRQLGACKTAQTGNGTVTVPASHAVVIFKVSTIDNTKPAVTWSFNSTDLQINPPSSTQQNLGGTGPVSIPAHQNVTVDTFVGIMVETSQPDGKDASSVNYFLVYPNVPPAPGTLSVKGNSSQTSYPFAQDCSVIAK
jgi:hypothetical protein